MPLIQDCDPMSPRWKRSDHRRLIPSSPYTDLEHQLDLSTVDEQSRLLAVALLNLKQRTPEYALVKYEESFDLDGLVEELARLVRESDWKWKQQDFYVVEFRSQLKEDIDNALLFKLDKESHKEANISGGLLKYWYGEPDAERRNLATCFWTDKTAAIAGGRGPFHKQARGVVAKMYESIEVKGLIFSVNDCAESWSLNPYDGHLCRV